MTAAEARAEIARLEAELVRAQAAREDAASAVHSLGLIIRGACAAMLSAADVLAPATAESTGGVERLFQDLTASAQAQAADDAPRAPVLHLPMRPDIKTAAAAATATADTTTQIPREEPKP